MYKLNVNQKIVLYLLGFLALAFCGYTGSWYLKQPAPIVYNKYQSLDSDLPKGIQNLKELPKENPKITVHIVGAVNEPGVYTIDSQSRIQDALQIAGGTSKDADLSSINYAAVLRDGSQLKVPFVSEKVDQNILIKQPEVAEINIEPIKSNVQNQEAKTIININKANVEELQKIPGIGSTIAQRIIQYRLENGLFQCKEDLLQINGVGNKKFDKIRDLIIL